MSIDNKSEPVNKSETSSTWIQNRRDFFKFIGSGSAALGVSSSFLLSSCSNLFNSQTGTTSGKIGLSPSSEDKLNLAQGMSYEIFCQYKDPINSTKSEFFGFNNDYTAFIPISSNEAYFWVNHEYPDTAMNVRYHKRKRTKEVIDQERYDVGGSLLKIKKDVSGRWKIDLNSQTNRRYTGTSKIPIVSPRPIRGRSWAQGTFANCAGGITPWDTFLTCEENYQDFYGERIEATDKTTDTGWISWKEFYQNPPEHYGWVVEINPKSGEAKKLTGIGRFAHECATCIRAKDGRVVVYSGDDKRDEHLYKFISESKDSLDKGELFVADLKKGKWLSLDINKNKILKENFKDQTDVQIHARKAAKLLGATPCNRPEDIEINPKTGEVFVCMTNNYSLSMVNNDYYGSILKLSEDGGDHASLTFKSSDFKVGGKQTGFACPDNLAFDQQGNLWITTDMSGSLMNKPPYTDFKNNGLFYIPMSGPKMGNVYQLASAPVDAELTGLSFSEDQQTLFLSVQHPGEKSTPGNLTSTWPNGKYPKPAVVQIFGESLSALTRGDYSVL